MNNLEKAIEKLEREFPLITQSNTVEQKAIQVMKTAVKENLISFCRQNEDFAAAVADEKHSFSSCMSEVAKNPGNGISDIEAYRRAVKYYFPDAEIEFSLKIKTSKPNNVIAVNFMDLLKK